MRVLWDTNVVAYWLSDDATFRHELTKAVADFASRSFFVSAVTTQELMVWARVGGHTDETYAFLSESFTPLDFNEACALEAARLAALTSRPASTRKATKQTKGERRDAIAHWQRDAAIAATASHHGLDVLLTANAKDFAPFEPYVSWKLRALSSA
jgi:predicted nucleic acid-binding protein